MIKYKHLFIEFSFHVLFWVLYLTYPTLIYGKNECFTFDINKAILTLVCIGIPSYIAYFFSLKNVRRLPSWILLVALITLLLYFRCTYGCLCNLNLCLVNAIIELLFVNAIFLILFITKRNIRNIKLLAESEQKRVEAELSALKAQINPHFLFNTLNMLYSDAIAINADIADKILKLSDNLHYLIHEGQKKEILLATEVKFIEDYLGLQKSRLADRIDVQFQVIMDNPAQKIPPLLIIPFIENAFKYSSMLEEKKNPLFISIDACNGEIRLQVKNKFDVKYRNDQKNEWKESGIGIENVKRRLALLFPSKHQILIWEENDVFFVDLMIKTL